MSRYSSTIFKLVNSSFLYKGIKISNRDLVKFFVFSRFMQINLLVAFAFSLTWILQHTSHFRSDRVDNFEKKTKEKVDTLNTKYDFSSVMHYGKFSFAEDRESPFSIFLLFPPFWILSYFRRTNFREQKLSRFSRILAFFAKVNVFENS